ncbi:MAG: hypothetical protein IJ710_05370 [Prevotella sp.]|nr:hypothetical protein [Prevotella sp.]
MKKTILIFGMIAVVCTAANLSCSGSGGSKNAEATTEDTDKPLNITIFIDLSDRLVQASQPSQIERDTALVGYIADCFFAMTKESDGGIQDSKNRIKVLFSPEPNATAMAKCAEDLILDIQKCREGAERKARVKGVKQAFQTSLAQIYSQAIEDNDFHGCDIWGFFSNKKVDTHCISDGYRNILIVLTDGYLFDDKTKAINGDTSVFIVPKILQNPNAALKVARNDLKNLEVLILEINPEPKYLPKMKSMLENWLVGMGLNADDIKIEDTGLPAHKRDIIERFLN